MKDRERRTRNREETVRTKENRKESKGDEEEDRRLFLLCEREERFERLEIAVVAAGERAARHPQRNRLGGERSRQCFRRIQWESLHWSEEIEERTE